MWDQGGYRVIPTSVIQGNLPLILGGWASALFVTDSSISTSALPKQGALGSKTPTSPAQLSRARSSRALRPAAVGVLAAAGRVPVLHGHGPSEAKLKSADLAHAVGGWGWWGGGGWVGRGLSGWGWQDGGHGAACGGGA